MAVAVEDGLITPVIRNAERKPLADIGREAKELAEKAAAAGCSRASTRARRSPSRTWACSDIDQFTAVINPPEAGIIAVGSIVQKPVVVDGATDAAAPHADHHELRSPGDRRATGAAVPQDAQADAVRTRWRCSCEEYLWPTRLT